jgi:hypothetical protein
MSDTNNTEMTLIWIAAEIDDYETQAAAIEERLTVLREVRDRLTGKAVATPQRRQRRARGDAPATPPAAPELGLAAQ